MSTNLQKNLARNIVKNAKRAKPLNKQQLIVSSGYSEITAKASPGIIIDQKGVKEELKILGFDEESAKKVVSEILNSEDAEHKDRLKAADMVFSVHGTYAPEKHLNVNIPIPLLHVLNNYSNKETGEPQKED